MDALYIMVISWYRGCFEWNSIEGINCLVQQTCNVSGDTDYYHTTQGDNWTGAGLKQVDTNTQSTMLPGVVVWYYQALEYRLIAYWFGFQSPDKSNYSNYSHLYRNINWLQDQLFGLTNKQCVAENTISHHKYWVYNQSDSIARRKTNWFSVESVIGIEKVLQNYVFFRDQTPTEGQAIVLIVPHKITLSHNNAKSLIYSALTLVAKQAVMFDFIAIDPLTKDKSRERQ